MNKARRKILNAQQDRLTAIKELIEETLRKACEEMEEIKGEIEGVKDEEEGSFENLSEGLQASERGQLMQETVGQLDSAISNIDDLITMFNADQCMADIDATFDYLEEAKGQAE